MLEKETNITLGFWGDLDSFTCSNCKVISFDSKNIVKADLYVLDHINTSQKLSFLRGNALTALSPIYLIDLSSCDSRLRILSDGLWKEDESLRKSQILLAEIEKFHPLSTKLSGLEQRLLTFLRFVISRKIEIIEPYTDIYSSVGYVYPLLKFFLGEYAQNELDQISYLVSLDLLKPIKLVNKVTICPYCGHYNIIFREVCPTCKALTIYETDLYYHFDCGHVAPKEDFEQDYKLICPKCHKLLKHIGSDYEIYNVSFQCRECKAIFENPKINILCLYCKKEFFQEALDFRDINIYQITSLGIQAAEEGKLPLDAVEEVFDQLQLIKWSIFQFLYSWELNRSNRYKDPFSLLIVYWDWNLLQTISAEYGVTVVRTYLEQVVKFLRENLRTVDVGSRYEWGKYVFLLPETPLENAKIVQQRLKSKISHIQMDLEMPEIRIDVLGFPEDLEQFSLEEIFRREI